MSKRKDTSGFTTAQSAKRRFNKQDAKKHSLDSDEEDDHDETQDVLDADDIEGEEEGFSGQVEGQRMTAFNMKEEMEEGHFDKEGHFIWKNEKEIRDNWLDNVDWNNIKNDAKYSLDSGSNQGLGEDSDSDAETPESGFDEIDFYKQMLVFMKPKETVNKALRRLGGADIKLSSVERLKRKKAGTLNTNEDVTKLTELANMILTKSGNMDVYQETFEYISAKIEEKTKSSKVAAEPELDMYADDFGDKEKEKMEVDPTSGSKQEEVDEKQAPAQLTWEFKWDQDKEQIEGPFDTKQMIKWANEGYFKTGVWVRKCGESSNFYTSNRIDFELYE